MLKVYRLNIFKIILVISISFSILIASIFIQSFNKKTYIKIYKSSNIYDNTKYSENDYLNEIDNYKKYILNNDDSALTFDGRYSQNEIIHMEDVRSLFVFSKRFALGIFFITLYFLVIMNKKEMKKFLKYSFLIPFIPAIFILPAILNFERFWFFFHKLLFRNELWLMDPNESLMINLLPQEVFNAISIKVITTFILLSLLFILLIYIIYILRREKNGIK